MNQIRAVRPCVFTISLPRGVLFDDLAVALIAKRPHKDYERVAHFGFGRYEIKTATETVARELAQDPVLKIKDCEYRLQYLGDLSTKVSIFYFPVDEDVNYLKKALEPYGNLTDLTEARYKKHNAWGSGVWQAFIEMSKPIPNYLKVHARDRSWVVQCEYQGVVRVCRKCGREGHLNSNCTTPKCSRCGAFGHDSCEQPCPRCYGDHPVTMCRKKTFAAALGYSRGLVPSLDVIPDTSNIETGIARDDQENTMNNMQNRTTSGNFPEESSNVTLPPTEASGSDINNVLASRDTDNSTLNSTLVALERALEITRNASNDINKNGDDGNTNLNDREHSPLSPTTAVEARWTCIDKGGEEQQTPTISVPREQPSIVLTAVMQKEDDDSDIADRAHDKPLRKAPLVIIADKTTQHHPVTDPRTLPLAPKVGLDLPLPPFASEFQMEGPMKIKHVETKRRALEGNLHNAQNSDVDVIVSEPVGHTLGGGMQAEGTVETDTKVQGPKSSTHTKRKRKGRKKRVSAPKDTDTPKHL